MTFLLITLDFKPQKAPKACKVRFPPGEKVAGRFKNGAVLLKHEGAKSLFLFLFLLLSLLSFGQSISYNFRGRPVPLP